jgi:serine/threonine protein kinase/Leucine-rich repeat (LRR) protein
MTMLDFSCPHCQNKLKVKPDLAGKRIRCPHCRQAQEVPGNGQNDATAALPGAAPSGDRAEAATLPPSPRVPAAEDPTLPPPSSPPDRAATWAASQGEPAGAASKEVVRGSFAYAVEGEIARGGMGAVMRAVDEDIRREVAVKFLLNQSDEGQRARFLEEARITGGLEHPNVVPIHQLGVHDDGRCFFSMKMVKGRSLADVLKAQARGEGGHTLVRLLGVFTAICNALGYAHSRHVIHRDLKPANVMVGDFGEVYVMDWGLAKVLGSEPGSSEQGPALLGEAFRGAPSDATAVRNADGGLTQAGAVMGTPSYMPPEQATGQAADQRSDIYSLGAILYEILTLTPPVVGSDPLAILMRVAEGDIEPPAKRAPQRARAGWVPPELSAVALKALARAPGDRYQSVEALKRDVELFLEGRSVSAKRDSAWELLAKLVKRNKGVSIATAAAILVLSAVVAVAYHSNYQQRVHAEIARGEADAARGQADAARELAEVAQKEAESNYQKFRREQEEKRARIKKSAPAFLRAAQLMTNEKNFDDALAQVTVALDADKDLTEAYLVKGHVLLALERFREAEAELRTFLTRKPGDVLVGKLADLAGRPQWDSAEYFWLLVDVLEKQKAKSLAEEMTRLAERKAGKGSTLLALYRKRIELAPGWAGLGGRLKRGTNGDLHMSFANQPRPVRDLSPLKGMKLSSLNLYKTAVEDLTPLEGMPLTELDLTGCAAVKDLRPLKGMKLTSLRIAGLHQITDLEPLRGMPLDYLEIGGCVKVTDLGPLRGMHTLTVLNCFAYRGMTIRSVEPLTGMKKLKQLNLGGSESLRDLTPLRGMPLERLNLYNVREVKDFEPLRGMRLTRLTLYRGAIRDLDVLKGMQLTRLSLDACGNVEDLTPLAGMKLTHLNMNGLKRIQDIRVLRGMPLTELRLAGCAKIQDFSPLENLSLMTTLHLSNCPQLKSLDVVRGMKQLDHLSIYGCPQLRDLGPLKGMRLKTIAMTPRYLDPESIKLVQGMNLEKIAVSHTDAIKADEFWKRYEAGAYK